MKATLRCRLVILLVVLNICTVSGTVFGEGKKEQDRDSVEVIDGGGFEVFTAYYRPDRKSERNWTEKAEPLRSFFSENIWAGGTIYVYLSNIGNEKVDILSVKLNGTGISELISEHEVVWWRFSPEILKPGNIGELTIRLRSPLEGKSTLDIELSNTTNVRVSVSSQPHPSGIEYIGFDNSAGKTYIYLNRFENDFGRIKRVFIENKDVTAFCRFVPKGYYNNLCMIVIDSPVKPVPGEYHTYTVESEKSIRTAAHVRTMDGWIPLGSYGLGDFMEYAVNGCNSYNSFGRVGRDQLHYYRQMGTKAVSMLDGGKILEYEMDNPALYALCIKDEPDLWDYYDAAELPFFKRVGFHAMEMVQRAEYVRNENPSVPSMITIDMTFKPANYNIYGPVADILNPDCYPLAVDEELVLVRDVVEAAMRGSAPKPVTLTYQGVFLAPRDEEELKKMKYPRPAFPEEVRTMMYYALGAGAKGLFNYIHATENTDDRYSRGTNEFPEIWYEIGTVYREIGRIAPLLPISYPVEWMNSSDNIWISMLLSGENTALLVYVNENYQQGKKEFRYSPVKNVSIVLPENPWLTGKYAFLVTEDGFQRLAVKEKTITVPEIETAGLILLTDEINVIDILNNRYEESAGRTARGIVELKRKKMETGAITAAVTRYLESAFSEYKIAGSGIQAYQNSVPSYWSFPGDTANVFEFGENGNRDSGLMGCRYLYSLNKENAGKTHYLYFMTGTWGAAGLLEINLNGNVVYSKNINSGFDGELSMVPFRFVQEGDYTIRFTLPGNGPKGGRITKNIYVIPEAKVFASVMIPE